MSTSIPVLGGPKDGGTFETEESCMFVGFIMRVNVPAPVLVVEKFDPNIYHEPACWIYALALRGDSWVYELKGNNIA